MKVIYSLNSYYTKHLKLNLINALLLCYINFPYLRNAYLSKKCIDFFQILIFLYIICFFLSSIFTISRYVYLITIPSLLLLGSIIGYCKYYYNIIFDINIIDILSNTDTREVLEFINKTIIVWGILVGIAPIWISYRYSKQVLWKFSNWVISEICYIVSITIIIVSFFLSSNIPYASRYFIQIVSGFFPINFATAIWDFARVKFSISSSKEDVTKNINFEETTPLKNLKIVLVIGESARSDRFSLNGYYRKTNPFLEKEKNIISFPETYALDTYTVKGVKHIFKLNAESNQNSLISVFKKIGFKTYWFSNQGIQGGIARSIASETDILSFSQATRQISIGNNYDEYLLPNIEKVLKQDFDKNSFIVLHTIGSHRLYDLRYPENFKYFQPICLNNNKLYYSVDECTDLEKLTNSYDNSILYTDYVLSKLIEILKSHNAIMLYISDHGESLGENGIFYHGINVKQAPKEQIHIPMIVWFSDEYLKNHQSNFDIAVKNKQNTLTQKVVFHSLLDCIGIKSSIIDKNLSFCKPN